MLITAQSCAAGDNLYLRRMKRRLIVTSDGSHTIHVDELDETYHSTHGAVQEAMHVFIEHGLRHMEAVTPGRVRIFEMGLGTGLNAWLTAVHATVPVEYTGIEAYPVEEELLKELNYAESEDPGDVFREIGQASWGETTELSTGMKIRKVHARIEEFEMPAAAFDLVYYDAFGPRAQGELWQPEVLEKMYAGLSPGGVLVTYCAQGQFKRHLKALGFRLEALPGPPGKREMTRAYKD